MATTGRSGSLQAEVIDVRMDINDDDEDVVIAKISITNEAPVPMGGLDVAIITNSGAKYQSQEGVTSLGPGIQRDWTFEFPLDSGEWTFVLRNSSEEIKLGSYAHDFEYSATQGRKLSSNIGSSLFTGAFDISLGDFGKVKEREMIDPTKVVLTSYSAENSIGGETLIQTDAKDLQTEDASESIKLGLDTPPLEPNLVADAPIVEPSSTKEPTLAQPSNSDSLTVAPSTGPPTPPPKPPAGPPAGPPTGPPSPPAGPPTPPPKPPMGPPAGPPTGPPGPPSGPPTPPPKPPTGPPAGPSTGPPGPPSGPPAGPPTGPPAGPPTSSSSQAPALPPKPDI